jgi:hypothetical protein
MDIDITSTKKNIENIITTKKQNIINLERALNVERSDLAGLIKFLEDLIKKDYLPIQD